MSLVVCSYSASFLESWKGLEGLGASGSVARKGIGSNDVVGVMVELGEKNICFHLVFGANRRPQIRIL